MPRPHWRFRSSAIYRWRYSLILAVFSALGIAFIVLSLRGAFTLDRREVVLWLVDTSSDLPPPTAVIRLHPGTDEDSLTVMLRYNNQPQTGVASVALGCQPSLTPLGYARRTGVSLLRTDSQSGMILRHFRLTVKDVDSPTIEQHYRGRIVSGVGRECRVHFRICFAAERSFPVKLIISNLEGIDILDVFPSPSFSDHSSMVLSLTPRDDLVDQCWLHLRDREAQYRHEYFLFLEAILMGVLASLLATILHSIVRDRETRRDSRRPPPSDGYWGC